MITLSDFDALLAWFRANSVSRGICPYPTPGSSASFRTTLGKHMQGLKPNVPKGMGVYVVTRQASSDVLYVGKGGELNSEGNPKKQDLFGRLKNSRKVPFEDMVSEGAIVVEYIVLDQMWLPAFVEAALLQAYFTKHHRLPRWNDKF